MDSLNNKKEKDKIYLKNMDKSSETMEMFLILTREIFLKEYLSLIKIVGLSGIMQENVNKMLILS